MARPKIKRNELFARVRARREGILAQEITPDGRLLPARTIEQYGEQKLTYLRKYLWIYSAIISNHFDKMWYLETCSGPGVNQIKNSERRVLGTPMLALTNEPNFTGYRFVELNLDLKNALDARIAHYCPGVDAKVEHGDCNLAFERALADIGHNDHFLAFMDPEGLELKWDRTVALAGRFPHSELYINFTYHMAIQRLITTPSCEQTVTEYMGSDKWIAIRDQYVSGKINHNQFRQGMLNLYLDGLRNLGYSLTTVSDVIRGANHQPLYYLIHATKAEVAQDTMKDVMRVKKQQTLF